MVGTARRVRLCPPYGAVEHFNSFVIPGLAKRGPGIHNPCREYGFRARAKEARPGMTKRVIVAFTNSSLALVVEI
jgi:hypothetical protein